jgi:hypothetical protein
METNQNFSPQQTELLESLIQLTVIRLIDECKKPSLADFEELARIESNRKEEYIGLHKRILELMGVMSQSASLDVSLAAADSQRRIILLLSDRLRKEYPMFFSQENLF